MRRSQVRILVRAPPFFRAWRSPVFIPLAMLAVKAPPLAAGLDHPAKRGSSLCPHQTPSEVFHRSTTHKKASFSADLLKWSAWIDGNTNRFSANFFTTGTDQDGNANRFSVLLKPTATTTCKTPPQKRAKCRGFRFLTGHPQPLLRGG